MRVLHTADLHLGQILYHNYDRVDEHSHFFGQLRQWCREFKPDALLLSGDIFDIPQPGAATREMFNRTFAGIHRSFPEMRIVITAGNHDSASRIEADSSVWDLSGVTLIGHAPLPDIQGETPADHFIVEIPSQGFIIALPFMVSSRKEAVQTILDRVAQRNTGSLPVVMMAHTAVVGSDFTGHGDIGTIKTSSLDEVGSGYDYLALGHIHRPQTIGQPLANEFSERSEYPAPVARYSGSALHVSCDEQYPHTVSLVDIDRHGGTVSLQRLVIDELRHFYILPEADSPAPRSTDEVMKIIDDFCNSVQRGYFRLRIDRHTPVPPDFHQLIYQRLEATGNEVRFNPNTIWENDDTKLAPEERPKFKIEELQQMAETPLDFVKRTIDSYPDLNLEELEEDFRLIEQEIRREQK